MLTALIMAPWHATRIMFEAQRRVTFSVLRLLSESSSPLPRLSDRRALDKAEDSVTASPKNVAAQRSTIVAKKRLRAKSKSSKRTGRAKVRRS
jgi:hypothetical protein